MRERVAKLLTAGRKLACLTLDFEMDYGDRVGRFNILQDKQTASLVGLIQNLGVPLTAFIRTDLLTDYPGSLELVKNLSRDFHCHSHTHNNENFNSRWEIEESAAVFQHYFNQFPLGYRAPQGVLREIDVDLLAENGFKFSSSIFPTMRPGKFQHLDMPLQPFVYDNGLMEIPFSVVPRWRYPMALSYLKLLGLNINRLLLESGGWPPIVVFNTHLHDFIVNPESYKQLPWKLKLAWGVNKNKGWEYFSTFVNWLKDRDYRFVTMSDLYHILLGEGSD